MKKFLILFIFIFSSLISCTSEETKTTYYLIRHAEKDRTDAANKDPNLNRKGLERAERWADYFEKINLNLLEITPALDALNGVAMELEDCAFSSLDKITVTDDPEVAFKETDFAFLVGAKPRGPGMERSDLLIGNAAIFSVQGKALNSQASRDVKVLVVGNPANTNALIALSNAPDLDPNSFTAMMRLDHNRAIAQLANKTGIHSNEIKKMTIWGNHSTTQYPDINHVLIGDKGVNELVEKDWIRNEFIPRVQVRGAEIIKARGLSSAASAASAAIDHMNNWEFGTAENDWVSILDASFEIRRCSSAG